ncbi:MAG: 4-hydroxy-tetrahydrodipicolinate synthase [Bacteroidales bacterium]|nr:4-hydroxy-tetrahydrodipicolinate synthase [Bacteroidales bacterium]
MKSETFSGVGVALVTPFDNKGLIDYTALSKLLDYIISGGINFIAMLGTTGEPSTMSQDEKQNLKKFIVDYVKGRVPIMCGIGGNCTSAVIDEIKNTDFSGIDAVLSISPYYTKPNQRGIYEHFKAISEASPVPIVLYNVPGRTSKNIEPATIIKLAKDCKNIIAVKEASGNMSQIMQVLKNKPADLKLFSGDDALTVPMYSIGAEGVISVVANVAPKQFVKMINLCSQGKFEEASKIHFKMLDLMNALFEDGSPAGAKAALAHLGIMNENLRLPLMPVCDEVRAKVISSLDEVLKIE